MPRASQPFSAVQADRPSLRGSQPRELPLWRKQRGALPPPGFEQPHVSKRGPRPVAKRKQREALLPPGFEHCQTSILGRMEMDNPAKFERFGHSFPNYGSGTPLGAQERALMWKQPDGILRRETYKSFETRGSLQAVCREDGVARFPGQGSTNASHPNFLEFQGFRSAASFLEMKTSFLDMWFKLEDTLQNHESVLVKMKEEIEKSSFDLKTAKEMALKEREELEAQSPGATKPMETVSDEQARNAKRVREHFESFSTDLSVQLAELNRIQQQVQEQQANLEALINFKTHNEAQEKGKNVRFETGSIKNLEESEARLAALQAELTGNRLASEHLEQAVLKGIAGLNQCDEVPYSQQGRMP